MMRRILLLSSAICLSASSVFAGKLSVSPFVTNTLDYTTTAPYLSTYIDATASYNYTSTGSAYSALAVADIEAHFPTGYFGFPRGYTNTSEGNIVCQYTLWWTESTVGEGTPSAVRVYLPKHGRLYHYNELNGSISVNTHSSSYGNINWGLFDNTTLSYMQATAGSTYLEVPVLRPEYETTSPSWSLISTFPDGTKRYEANVSITMPSLESTSTLNFTNFSSAPSGVARTEAEVKVKLKFVAIP